MNILALLSRARRFAPLMCMLVSAAIAVDAYLQALHFSFISDDTAYIPDNTKLTELHLTELWRLFTKPYNDFFEFLPLRDLSYWIEINLFGLNPSAFRIDNIVLYLLCLPLVYTTTSELWRYFRPADAPSASWVAAIVTSLFALHPSHAEAVVWIAGRKDVLSALFSLLALWFAISARQEQGLSVRYATAALLALLAAMFSKASAVAVAPVISLLWIIFWRDIPTLGRRRSLLLWPFASILLAACVALVFAAIIPTRTPLYFGIEAVIRSLSVLGWLARLSVSPESRHFLYPVLEDSYLPVMVALGVAVLTVSMVGIVMVLRKRSLAGFSLAAFFLLCLPVMQLVPYMPPSLVSDRFIFLAAWPIILLLVTSSWHFRPEYRAILFLIIAFAWGFQASERTRDWRSLEAMIDVDIHAYPGFYMPPAYKIFGVQLPRGLRSDAIETADSITLPEIKALMVDMIKADNAVYVAVTTGASPGEAMNLLNKFDARVTQLPNQAKWNPLIRFVFGKALTRLQGEWKYLSKQFPDDMSVRYNAGLWMLGNSKPQDAAAHLRVATNSQRLPESVRGQAYKNLGLALIESGHIAEAEAPLRAALEQAPPDYRAYCLLMAVYKLSGRIQEFARAKTECLDHIPNEKVTQ